MLYKETSIAFHLSSLVESKKAVKLNEILKRKYF